MKTFWKRLCRDQNGATAVEYGLILALIFLAMVSAVGTFSNSVINTWDTVRETSSEAIDRT
ncbi:Flp family type IVb pilin [Citromicrobium bathyomarinum]|uniref:Flp family type IVb pilin n=1 Tax=Citromicrobium bathyomarinum TaxID=72174 RepID=UPI003159E6D2